MKKLIHGDMVLTDEVVKEYLRLSKKALVGKIEGKKRELAHL